MKNGENFDEDLDGTLADTDITEKILPAIVGGEILLTIHDCPEALYFAKTGDLKLLFDFLNQEAQNKDSALYRALYAHKNLGNDEKPLHPDTLELLKKRIDAIDALTQLPRREKQTELLRQRIASIQEHKQNYTQFAKRMGFISFDVRGLKMVNDVMNDHKYGDRYLKKIADYSMAYIEPLLRQVAGNGIVEMARDSGDEFSFYIEAETQNLDELMSVSEFFKKYTADMSSEFEQTFPAGEKLTVIQIINRYMEFRMSSIEVKEDVIPREELERFAQKTEGPDYKLPADFKLKYHIASGACTLSEIIENPEKEDFKVNIELLQQSHDGQVIPSGLSPQERIAYAVDRLLEAIRTRADGRSYDSKSKQNMGWINSDDPLHLLMIKMISRNDVTVMLAQKALQEKDLRKIRETELAITKQERDDCWQGRAKSAAIN